MVSNATDLLTFGNALFHHRLLQQESLQAMVAEGPFHPRNSNYGLGLEIVRPDYQTTDLGPRRLPTRLQVGAVVRAVPRHRHRRPHQHLPANPTDLAELVLRTLPERTPQP